MRTRALAGAVVTALLTLGFAASTDAAVSSGHSGWSWGDPAPQGNDIHGIEFTGARGYAAGNFGTLLRSEDAGATWAGLSTGITQDLARVRIIDADSLVIAGGCAVRRSDDAGQTFTRLPWTASDLRCAGNIASLHFPSSDVGYLLVQNGTVLRTADAGKTWTRKTAVPDTSSTGGTAQPTDIFFTSVDTGVATTSIGRIYRTVDGGNSWTLAGGTPNSTALNGISFFDANTGYAVGGAGLVLATTNGGTSWTPKSTGGGLDLSSIHCATATSCLVTVSTGERLLRTLTGGDVFESVTPSTQKIFAAAFSSPTRAVAGGALGTTVVSDDAGVTWRAVGSRLSDDFTRLRATSPSLAFAIGENGALARSADGGATWTNLGVSTSANVVDAAFPSQNTGYALDSAGTVLRTDNGGASWEILDTGTTSRPGSLLAFDANRVLLFGPRGVRRSTNGGDSFNRVRQRAIAKASVSDFDRAGSTVFAFGFKALYASTTGGKSWKKLKLPPGRSGLASIDFVTARRGFALTLDGRLWQTANAGRRWRDVPGIGNDSAFELAFTDARNGYAAIRDFGGRFNGYVLRTSDGGKTWQPQLVDNDGIVEGGLVATGTNSALLLTLSDSLFATTTGGQAGSTSSLTLKTKKRKLRKRTTIKVTGRLSGAEGGEQVVVAMRGAKLNKWRQQVVTAAANGSFTTSWKVGGTSYFVAQWSGDDARAGDGSNLLTVKVAGR
jgi:photosystem II stability/assembly factor-like uncharacterized protein